MSIYSTFDHYDIAGVHIWEQGVRGWIGRPEAYPEGDPYGDFLPPSIDDSNGIRAVVFVLNGTSKDGQRYVDPLLTVTGSEYTQLGPKELKKTLRAILKHRGLM